MLVEADANNVTQRWFVYGNYIDEPLLLVAGGNNYYYVHDHLYSPVCLVDDSNTVVERLIISFFRADS